MGHFNGPFVIIDDNSGKIWKRVIRKRIEAMNTIRHLNAMDYDMPLGGPWKMIAVDAPEGTSDEDIIKMAKAKEQTFKKESKTFYNKFLGDDEVNNYINESLPNVEEMFTNFKERVRQMDEIHNDIINTGNQRYIGLAQQVLRSYGYMDIMR